MWSDVLPQLLLIQVTVPVYPNHFSSFIPLTPQLEGDSAKRCGKSEELEGKRDGDTTAARM